MHLMSLKDKSLSIKHNNTLLNNLLSDNTNKNECSSVVDLMLKHFFVNPMI